ncbi:galactoside alpha-(1,2)-fucosyltransferase 2-like [Euwallacea similis]|uniref:galactoside alpha-(1,2)-fucosyltransferase 2-like n=1 Tax=Euwallacea similis TaxID=1736056 RepID=UPI00344B324A
MVQRKLIFLSITIFTGLLFSFFYVLNLNKPRFEYIGVLKEHALGDHELRLASPKETDDDIKNSSSNKNYSPEIANNSLQQLKATQNRTTFANLREYLCSKESKSRKRTFEKSAVKEPCPKKHIVTYVAGGRTGNQLWKYAEIWVIVQITGLTPYDPGCVKYGVKELFENLSIPNMDNIAHCPIDFKNTTVDSMDKWNGNQSIVLPQYKFSKAIIIPYLYRLVNEEFVFKKQLRIQAQEILREASNNVSNSELITFIGVHVRRDDYISYLDNKYHATAATNKYYLKAIGYYKNKYKRCLFIIISDDPQWCYDQFGKLQDVFVASYKRNNTAGEDLAIMAACNHSIFDYGTYGEWGAILTGGETIYKSINNKGRATGHIAGWQMMH